MLLVHVHYNTCFDMYIVFADALPHKCSLLRCVCVLVLKMARDRLINDQCCQSRNHNAATVTFALKARSVCCLVCVCRVHYVILYVY
jgi:hypothetical protein